VVKVRSCAVVLLCLSALTAFAQKPKRITVLQLLDRTGSGKTFGIGQKAADAIMNKLAESGKFTMIERESLAAIQSEKNLKFDAEFDPRNAPKSGLQKICDYIVTGTVDEFSAIQNSTAQSGIFHKTTEVNGTAALKISIRITSTTTGEILTSTSGRAEKSGLLGKSTENTTASVLTQTSSLHLPGTSTKSAVSTDQSLNKMVDADIDEVASIVVEKLINAPAVLTGGKPTVIPKVMGMQDGLVVVNKGSDANIETGNVFDVLRATPGMVDPDTGKAVTVHKKVCSLTITIVEDGTSQGKCVGGTPQPGDELKVVQ
jgi:curli biogenesis system outer membrane secretion channel CsgG